MKIKWIPDTHRPKTDFRASSRMFIFEISTWQEESLLMIVLRPNDSIYFKQGFTYKGKDCVAQAKKAALAFMKNAQESLKTLETGFKKRKK